MTDRKIIACRADIQREITSDIIATAAGGIVTLKASPTADGDRRRELIKSVRGGEHVEVALSALAFRQRDGSPNRKHVRVAPKALGALAASFIGRPVLVDHAQHTQASRIGTITSSDLSHDAATGWDSIVMGVRIVKPDAVISVLDGTIDSWSVGWLPTGPILCSIHGADLRSSAACGCWPGDRLSVDGVARTVEFEFQSAEGVELSAVNVPAVDGTRTSEIRQALAAELGLFGRSFDVTLRDVEIDHEDEDEDEEAQLDAELVRVAAAAGQDVAELRALAAERRATIARLSVPVASERDLNPADIDAIAHAQGLDLAAIAAQNGHEIEDVRATVERIARRRGIV